MSDEENEGKQVRRMAPLSYVQAQLLKVEPGTAHQRVQQTLNFLIARILLNQLHTGVAQGR